MLWRNSSRNFSRSSIKQTEPNKSILLTKLSNETLTKLNEEPWNTRIHRSLSLTQGAVFRHYASEFLQVQVRSGLPNDKASHELLEGKVKEEYLDYLKDEWGMEGLHAFLSNFVGSLVKREKSKNRNLQSQPNSTTK